MPTCDPREKDDADHAPGRDDHLILVTIHADTHVRPWYCLTSLPLCRDKLVPDYYERDRINTCRVVSGLEARANTALDAEAVYFPSFLVENSANR